MEPMEYFDPKAPWNRSILPKTIGSRETLVRKHLDELLKPLEQKKSGAKRYSSPQRHSLRSLLMEMIPCSGPSSSKKYPLRYVPIKVALMHRVLSMFVQSKISEGYLDNVYHKDKEIIAKILAVSRAIPLYALTQNERIDAWDKHIQLTQGEKKSRDEREGNQTP